MNEETSAPQTPYISADKYDESPAYFEMLSQWHRTHPAFRTRLDNFLSILAPWMQGSERVLDFGCAAGAVGIEIARRWPQTTVVGVDYSKTALSYAKENAVFFDCDNRISFQLGDESTLEQWPEGSFDLILAADVIEHVQSGTLLLKRLGCLLSNQGILLLETPNIEFSEPPQLSALTRMLQSHGMRSNRFLTEELGDEKWAEKYHVNLYNRDRLEREIQTAGLQVIMRKYPHWYTMPNPISRLFAKLIEPYPELCDKYFSFIGTDFLYLLQRKDSLRDGTKTEQSDTFESLPISDARDLLAHLLMINRVFETIGTQRIRLFEEVIRAQLYQEEYEVEIGMLRKLHLDTPASRKATARSVRSDTGIPSVSSRSSKHSDIHDWSILLPNHPLLQNREGYWKDLGSEQNFYLQSAGAPELGLVMEAAFQDLALVFLRHAWSGFVEIVVDDYPSVVYDLYAPQGCQGALLVIRLGPFERSNHHVEIRGTGRKNEAAKACEVILEAFAVAPDLHPGTTGESVVAPAHRWGLQCLLSASTKAGANAVYCPELAWDPPSAWLEESLRGFNSNKILNTGLPGAKMSWESRGMTNFRLLKQPYGGKLAIIKNDSVVETLDLYSERFEFQAYSLGVLDDSKNRFTVEVLKEINPEALGSEVWLEQPRSIGSL